MINFIKEWWNSPPKCKHIWKELDEEFLRQQTKMVDYGRHIDCDIVYYYALSRACVSCGKESIVEVCKNV